MKLTSLILIALGACATATAENLWDNVTQTLEKYVYISKMAFSVGNGTGQQYTFGKGGVTLDTQQTMASSSKVLSWGSCFGLRASVYSHTTHNLVRAVPCGHVHPRCREWGAPRNWFKSFWGWLHFLLWPFCFVIPWCFFSTHLVSTFLSSIGTPTCISLRCGTGGQRMHPTSAPVWLWNLSFRSQAVRPLSHRTNHNFDTHTLWPQTLVRPFSGLFTKDAGGEIDCLSFNTKNNYTSEECAKQIYDKAVWVRSSPSEINICSTAKSEYFRSDMFACRCMLEHRHTNFLAATLKSATIGLRTRHCVGLQFLPPAGPSCACDGIMS